MRKNLVSLFLCLLFLLILIPACTEKHFTVTTNPTYVVNPTFGVQTVPPAPPTLISTIIQPVPETTSIPPDPIESSRIYYSEKFFLTVNVPSGWGIAEGPESFFLHEDGQVAFNSWGENGFWARPIKTGNRTEQSSTTVMSQIPEGGAYVALMRIYPPWMLEYNPFEYAPDDLSGLVKPRDWRLEANWGAQFFEFNKLTRRLCLQIACNAKASDDTVAQLNALIQSWRFNVPEGDLSLASTQARLLLPEQVKPLYFSTVSSWQTDLGIARITETEVRGSTIHFRFIYIWNFNYPLSTPYSVPKDSSHWWEIDVPATGKANITDQGGAPLP